MVVVTMTEKNRIVVGVDGSPSSINALRWAARQAKLTGAEIEAVTVWSYPAGYGLAPVSDGAADLEGDAGKVLFEALAEVSGIGPDVVIEPLVVQGYAATRWCASPRTPACWWSAAADTAGSPGCCSAR
jgi:nucleotide-binding universal stress UspA family protein